MPTPPTALAPAMPDPARCIAYLRVSTERQATEVHTSLADQLSAVGSLAKRLGVEIERTFTDAGASGATVDGRPQFLALLQWCAEHRKPRRDRGLVLVLNDSRFGRFDDPDEAAYWRHHMIRLGWLVRFAEGDEVEGDMRTVVRAIGSVQATEYRRNLIANTRRGMAGAAALGFWTREAPYGYRRMVVYPEASARVLDRRQLKAPNEKVRLTPHPDEARIVRCAFEAYATGSASLGVLARQLARRVPSRRWSRTVVTAMLRNAAYRGDIVGGRRRDGGGVMYGRPGAHEAIVSPRLWDAVQARLSRNARMGSAARSHYLLTGLMACPYCGSTYTGGGGGRSRTENPLRPLRRFYRDNGGLAGICPGRIGTVMRHIVDDAAIGMVTAALQRPAVRARIERALDGALRAASESPDAPAAALRTARARIEQRRDRLVAAVAAGTVLADEAATQLAELRRGLSETEERIQAARFSRLRRRDVQAERDRIMSMAMDFPAVAARLSGPRLRELVEPWLGSATFDKVSRDLVLGIRPIPAVPSFLPTDWRGPTWQKEGGLILRRSCLVQPGHEYRILRAGHG